MIEDIKFALHITTHPADGFWDMKYEKKGKLKVSLIIIFLTFCTLVFERLVTGFAFDPYYNRSISITYELRKVLLPLILFCIGNWSVTTLMDGEGKASEILMATGYSLTPLILIRIPLAILTNFLTLKEAAYVGIISSIAYIWALFLLFMGIMTIHQYSVTKALFTMIVTVVSMAIIVFICALFFYLTTEIVGFAYTIYKEIIIRF